MNIDFANMDIQTYRNFEYSRLREMGVTHGPEALFEERVIENPICETRLLLYRPLHSEDMILPVFVNLHGGGFVLGNGGLDSGCPFHGHMTQVVRQFGRDSTLVPVFLLTMIRS